MGLFNVLRMLRNEFECAEVVVVDITSTASTIPSSETSVFKLDVNKVLSEGKPEESDVYVQMIHVANDGTPILFCNGTMEAVKETKEN